MRVCLSNPPWREGKRRGIRAGCRVPNRIGDGQLTFVPFPFTLAYGMSRLEAEGVPAMILDGIGEDLDDAEYQRRIVAFAPELIVNEMSAASWRVDLSVASKLKELTGARIALCGPHPSATAPEVLASRCVDFVLVGEFEETLPELVRTLEERQPLDTVKGLAYRDPCGQVRVNARRPLVPDLDALPFPHRDTLPMRAYRVAGYPEPVLFMYGSRGCPYRCTYCLWPQTMYAPGQYRARAARAIVEEVEHAQARYGPFRSIYYDDDTFNLGRERMLGLARELAARSWRIPFGCNARADHFDAEVMDGLAEVGLFNIRIGVESGDPEILRRARKDLDLDSVRRCIDLAHRAGVRVHVTFTVGLSGESWTSVERTVRFARSIPADSAAFTITTPFPGTSYYEEVGRGGFLEGRDWAEFDVVTSSVVRTDSMSAADITRAEKCAMRRVYSSPGYLLRRLRYATSGRELLALARKAVGLALRRS